MRRFCLLAVLALLAIHPAAFADDRGTPVCTDAEFRQIFDMVVDYQIQFDGEIGDADELRRVSQAQIAARGERLSRALPCAESIAIQRLLFQLGGDSLARAALDMAASPADENPYRRLPADQARIESLLAAMLGVDRSRAPQNRDLPPCAQEDLSRLADALGDFLSLLAANPDSAGPASIAAIDELLRWRENELPALPLCAESIDLLRALNAAATDAAATAAFKFARLPAEWNPFPPLLAAAIEQLSDWRDQLPADLPQADAFLKAGAAELPPCPKQELTAFNDSLRPAYAELSALATTAQSRVDLIAFAEAQLAFRASILDPAPTCAEAFALRWQLEERLADVPVLALREAAATNSIQSLDAATAENAARATASLARLESALVDEERRAVPPAANAPPACAESDLVFLFSYLAPNFRDFTADALRASRPEDALRLISQSYALRQLLWTHLPRCAVALELGLLMRSAAADIAAMLALELAGAPVLRIPYLPAIAADLERFSVRLGDFYSACGDIASGATTYYVVAENIANIRACASTACSIVTTASRGQRLDIVDDMSSWYEVTLPSCETAYIAGFLVSQTPPPR